MEASERTCGFWRSAPQTIVSPASAKRHRASTPVPSCARSPDCAADQEPAAGQRQAGWSRPQPAYLTISDEEARQMMRALNDRGGWMFAVPVGPVP
jgi:hypothetical protein